MMNNMASKDEVVSAVAALLEGERIKDSDRWLIFSCYILGTHALVNFVNKDWTAIVSTKRLIQRDAEGESGGLWDVLLMDKRKYKAVLVRSG